MAGQEDRRAFGHRHGVPGLVDCGPSGGHSMSPGKAPLQDRKDVFDARNGAFEFALGYCSGVLPGDNKIVQLLSSTKRKILTNDVLQDLADALAVAVSRGSLDLVLRVRILVSGPVQQEA